MVRTHDVCAPAMPSAVAAHDLRPLPVTSATLDPAHELGAWQRASGGQTLPELAATLEHLLSDGGAIDPAAWTVVEALAWAGAHASDDDAWGEVAGATVSALLARTATAPPRDAATGPMLRAAIAHARVTGDDALVAAARARVDRLTPDELAGLEGALIELARHTGEHRYADAMTASLAPKVPRARDAAAGAAHDVLTLAAALADAVAENTDGGLDAAADRIWASLHGAHEHVTGALAAAGGDGTLGAPHHLPPDHGIAHTCAAVASFDWNWRMLLTSGDARHADAMERSLVNAIAASIGPDGTGHLATGPLQRRTSDTGAVPRNPAPETLCCVAAVARLVASLGAYIATGTGARARLHLYAAGTVRLGATTLTVGTDYPWDGRVTIDVDGPLTDLALRIPAWCDGATVTVDGSRHEASADADGYARVTLAPGAPRTPGTPRIVLDLPMPVDVLDPHPRADALRGAVALRRGPVVFCLEQADLPPGIVLEDVRIDLRTAPRPGPGLDSLRAGATVLASGIVRSAEGLPLATALRRSPHARAASGMLPGRIALRAIPYARWANRAEGAMRVWIPVDEEGSTA